jgi:hypothetical protein
MSGILDYAPSVTAKLPYEEAIANGSYFSNSGTGDFFDKFANNFSVTGDNYAEPSYNFSFLPSSNGAGTGESSWLDALGSGLKSVGSYAANNPKTVLGALGLGTQLISSIGNANSANANAEAARTGATNYMNALQSSKDEARSQFLQNQAAQRNKLRKNQSSVTSLEGRNLRDQSEDLRRGQNENYASFLLDQAQTTTPSLQAFTAAETPSSSNWWTGFSGGTASVLGQLLGNQMQTDTLSDLFKRKTS